MESLCSVELRDLVLQAIRTYRFNRYGKKPMLAAAGSSIVKVNFLGANILRNMRVAQMVPGGRFLFLRIDRGEHQELQLLNLSERHRCCVWACNFRTGYFFEPQICLEKDGSILVLTGHCDRYVEVNKKKPSENEADFMFVCF